MIKFDGDLKPARQAGNCKQITQQRRLVGRQKGVYNAKKYRPVSELTEGELQQRRLQTRQRVAQHRYKTKMQKIMGMAGFSNKKKSGKKTVTATTVFNA